MTEPLVLPYGIYKASTETSTVILVFFKKGNMVQQWEYTSLSYGSLSIFILETEF